MIGEDEPQEEVRVSAESVPDRTDFSYSVVIPVYNSEAIVADDRRAGRRGLRARPACDYEIVLVNDGSPDRSWSVISDRAARHARTSSRSTCCKNYGQHNANLAGLRSRTGDYVITMDDDLQNPPDQALLLIDAALAGSHDVVFGEFEPQAGDAASAGSAAR